MSVLSVVMARRESSLPRRVVVAVTADRVHLLEAFPRGIGRELRSWPRAHLQVSAERSGRRWEVWVQPPGGADGFELRTSSSPANDEVVAAMCGR